LSLQAGDLILMAKRLFDVLLSALGLALLAPLLLLMAVWIKLDSPGPVLFRQSAWAGFGAPFRSTSSARCGRRPAQGQITIGADPRITRVGPGLRAHQARRTAAAVGRAARHDEPGRPAARGAALCRAVPRRSRRIVLAVRPGITDPASLEYRDESEQLAGAVDPERAYVETLLPAKLALAVRYVQTSTLAGDMRLVLRTLGALVHARRK
jgi:lipopolysaccharide/colanic/teichoic acid biosynthesis glycosyltransferase